MARGLPLLLLAALGLSACSGPAQGDGTAPGDAGPGAAPAALDVRASVYPLQYVAERVGGERVRVTPITPPGGDAHNVELSPREVAEVEAADLVVHLSGFQPAIDDAIGLTGASALDVAEPADLHPAAELEPDHGGDAHSDDDRAGDDHAEEGGTGAHGAGDGHDHGPDDVDPHFWLDPDRLADVAAALAEELAALDPDHAADYRARAGALAAELATLDAEYADGLASCESETAVVSHEAYGYLLGRFGLRQEGIAGIDPESEPSPARLAEIAAVVEAEGVSTVFVDSELDTGVTEALAEDLGIATAVLDPLEVQQAESADYQDVMRANLAALRTALGCA